MSSIPGPSRPSTTQPSPTSTVCQTDTEDTPVGSASQPNGKLPDEERGALGNEEKNLQRCAPTASTAAETEGQNWTVRWDGPDDPGCPLNTPPWRKWAMTFIVAGACVCVTCCSSMAGSTYDGMTEEYGISRLVATLTISLYVAGLGVGPMFLGPVSEFIGRKKVLHWSFAWFFLLNFPVAFANNVSVHMIFRFLTGFAGSAFLSVSGGAISDVFKNEHVATPMMIFSASPFLGPVLGPLVAGFINQNANWHWTFYVVIIWSAIMLALIVLFVPETYDPQLLRKRAIRQVVPNIRPRSLLTVGRKRKETGDERWKAPMELADKSFFEALKKSIKTPFILLTTQPMVLFLDLWSALVLGILYLSFGGVPYVFQTQYGFSLQETGLAFLGIGFGQVVAVCCQPFFNRQYRRLGKQYEGQVPPEARLIPGFYGAVFAPFGLLLFGLTSFENVPWIIPILSSSFFGVGMVFAYTSTFTYLVDAYRPVAASALASNSFLRSAFAAGFPLFGRQMYERLGAVGGTCLLSGLLFLATPLPFIFYKIGGRIRERSPFAQ